MKKKVKKHQPRTKQENALVATFIVLVILVIVLVIIALNMKNIVNDEKANIVIPILEANAESEISVDISDMKKKETKEYIFKVSNYKDNDVNETKLSYDINITSSENASIKLYKNASKDNIISQENLVVENNLLPKSKKKVDEYHLIIEVTNEPDDHDKITLKINS